MKRILVPLALTLIASTACADIYTWKDAKGTVFYTNSLHEIPARYLKKARVLDVATGKTGGLATAQPATAAPAGQAPVPLPAPPMAQPAPMGLTAPTAPVAPAAPAAAAPAGTTAAPPAPGQPGAQVPEQIQGATAPTEAARPRPQRPDNVPRRGRHRRTSTDE